MGWEVCWGGTRVETLTAPTARADVVARGEGGKVKTLFWLMGGGGTGKSVTVAVVCKR